MDREELRQLVRDTVRETVRETVPSAVSETFTKLGLDISDSENVLEAQADFLYLRKSRRGSDEVIKWAKRSIVTALVGTVLFLIGEGAIRFVMTKLGLPGAH